MNSENQHPERKRGIPMRPSFIARSLTSLGMTADTAKSKEMTNNMIQLSRNYSLPEREDQIIPIKVIAVGSAGSNALDRVVLDGMDKSDLIAANTDVQSLASSVAAVKVQLGRTVTRGLGTGGDPELGFDAAQESADEIRQALADARLIFICAGLGGGTGSGAAPRDRANRARNGRARYWVRDAAIYFRRETSHCPGPGCARAPARNHRRRDLFRKRSHGLTWSPRKPVFIRLLPLPT